RWRVLLHPRPRRTVPRPGLVEIGGGGGVISAEEDRLLEYRIVGERREAATGRRGLERGLLPRCAVVLPGRRVLADHHDLLPVGVVRREGIGTGRRLVAVGDLFPVSVLELPEIEEVLFVVDSTEHPDR